MLRVYKSESKLIKGRERSGKKKKKKEKKNTYAILSENNKVHLAEKRMRVDVGREREHRRRNGFCINRSFTSRH